MVNKAEQAYKDYAKDTAEVAVNGYLGGIGAHPSLGWGLNHTHAMITETRAMAAR